MKIVSNNIKNALKEPTTQRKGKILVNGNYYEVFNVEYYADAYNEGNVIGNAIASQLDFDLPYIEKFDSFKYFDGVWTGNDYEYVDFGTFTVFDEKDQDEFNKHITAFDNLIKFNAIFEDKKDYPKTLFQELQNICNQAGVELENASIVNGNFIVENNQFVAGENLKTVLKNICGISGTYAVIKNDKIVLQLKNVTNEVINKSHHEPIEWKRKTYGINQVVLGLKDVGGEYVVKQDDEDIAINGVHKLVINDNYFAYTQEKRQQLINELFEQVKGFGYIPYELKGEWLNYMDIGDTITIDENETMILRINGKSPKSLESQMEAPAIIDSSIDYVDNTNTLADKQRRTELWVDKNVGEIRSEITKIDTTVENITTTTKTNKGGNHLYLEDAMESNALEYIVEGKSEQETRSGKNLFNKDDLHELNAYFAPTITTITSSDVNRTLYVPCEPNKDYVIQKMSSAQFCFGYTETLPAIGIEVFNIKGSDDEKTYNNKKYQTITTGENAKYLVCRYHQTTQDTTITKQDILNSIQIEEGIIPTEYEQYGASPSPDYPSEIKTIKGIRNLFKVRDDAFGTQLVTYTKLTDNSIRISATRDTATTWTGYVEVPINLEDIKPNTTYTFSKKHKIEGTTFNRAGAIRTKINGTYNTLYDIDSITFTTPENLQSLSLVFYIAYTDSTIGTGTIDFEDIMLEEGSIRHSPVPYGSWLEVKDTGKNLFGYGITAKDVTSTYRSNSAQRLTLSSTDSANKVKFNYKSGNYCNGYIAIDGIDGTLDYSLNYDIVENTTSYKPTMSIDKNNSDKDKLIILISGGNGGTIENSSNYFIIDNIQIEKGSTPTDYEPYKEQSTLIDMNKPNLFDKDNANIFEGTIDGSLKKLNSSTGRKTIYISCKPNTTYTIQKIVSSRFITGYTTEIPNSGVEVRGIITKNNDTKMTITTDNDANYLCIFLYHSTYDTTITIEDILNSLVIYEGTNTIPYYELSSINDIKDILTIQNNQTTINQRIGKVVLNGSESDWKLNSSASTLNGYYEFSTLVSGKPNSQVDIISDYFPTGTSYNNSKEQVRNRTDNLIYINILGTRLPSLNVDGFKTWLSENPVTVYYILDEPQIIELGDFPIMLYNNINNVTLISDLETTTQITYLRNTPLSNDYATNQRVDKTDSDLEQTNNSLNQTKQDVENTAVDLHNNYYDKEQIDSIITTTEQEITTLRQTVETNTSSTNLQISVIEEQLKNGVTAVKTETGYTFDKNGLNISKTGSEMSSTLDNDGLSVKRDNTEVLTVRSAGVETENLKVRTYFTIGSHTRVEDYGNGTGFFHIGGV